MHRSAGRENKQELIVMENKAFFEVDASRCVRCGRCAEDCFFGALKKCDDGLPVMAQPAKCMHCQHCFAICPAQAIRFEGKSPDVAPALGALPLPSGEQMANLIRARRSIRRYAERDVDRNVLENILSTLANAPTGCNARELTFTCISTRRAMDDFRSRFIRVLENHRAGTKLLPRWLAVPAIQLRSGKQDVFFRGAPGMLVVSADKKAPGVVTPQEDVVVACAQFDLLAQAHGLGTCWCGFLRLAQKVVPELLPELFGFSADTPFYAVLFGHRDVAYSRSVIRDDAARIDWH